MGGGAVRGQPLCKIGSVREAFTAVFFAYELLFPCGAKPNSYWNLLNFHSSFSIFWSVFASFTSFWVVGDVAKVLSGNPKVRGAPSDSLSSPVVGGCWNQRRVTRSTWDLYERAWRYCIESFHPLAHPNRRPTYFFSSSSSFPIIALPSGPERPCRGPGSLPINRVEIEELFCFFFSSVQLLLL